MTHMSRKPTHRQGPGGAGGKLRIIAGQWRRRHVSVLARDGLRPTPDRVRETLFNWLSPHTRAARCLDLFAGTGALGLEALSRGAAHCTFVEQDPVAARHLRQVLEDLQAVDATVKVGDALQLLQTADPTTWDVATTSDSAGGFDLVFVDPPYQLRCQLTVLDYLSSRGFVSDGALVYVEAGDDIEGLDESRWEVLRAKRAGQVRYHLLQHRGGA
tara:strand:- start:2828 stop:3472 length:645 start_codon:yes stop_codon:yes gene_type:complete